MEKASIFKNLKCWQAVQKLLVTIHSVSHHEKMGEVYFLRNLLKRGAIGAMSAVPEGFDKPGCDDFIRYLNTTRCGVAEVKCMVQLLNDLNIFSTQNVNDIILQMADDTRSCTEDLITYLQNNS